MFFGQHTGAKMPTIRAVGIEDVFSRCQKKNKRQELINATEAIIRQGPPIVPSSMSSDLARDAKDLTSLIHELPIFSFAEYMDYVMYNEQCGYYSYGKTRIRRGGDFVTNTSIGRGLAIINALDMFQQWFEMGQPDTFNNYEGGCGNGQLAYDTLNIIRKLAFYNDLSKPDALAVNKETPKDKDDWAKFYHALHYYIIEISPALSKQQREKCQIFQDKLTVLNESILDFHLKKDERM